MFVGDLFEDEEQKMVNYILGRSANDKRVCENMAEELGLPDKKRGPFVGLKNQGATCYLNSFFQIIYMIPEVRKLFLELDVDKLTSNKKTVLIGLKTLFMQMQYLDSQDQTTDVMSKAFGWEKSEVLDQHDIQEAMRIVFDFLEQGLSGSVALNEFHRLLK